MSENKDPTVSYAALVMNIGPVGKKKLNHAILTFESSDMKGLVPLLNLMRHRY
eukprot:m.251703 g.251703  ORF g.251703 m.251703 type:complete len:53 (+) comp10975_c0_seq44:79-237(+)